MVNKADGMFLYARLVLNDLPDLTQGLQIDNLIEELPDGLDQISLQRIISLRKPGRKYAKRVFKFVLGEQRPLRISELQQAMVIEGKIDFLSTKRSISLPLLCGSLIEIMNDDTVCLVHSSLNEYLLTKDNTLGLRHATLHRSISVACLTYLQGLGAVIGNSDSFGSLLRSNGYSKLLNYSGNPESERQEDYAEDCDATELQSLIRLYGPPFRYTDVKCIHFHAGFPDSEQRRRHLETHNRIFKCTVKTCPFNQIGFSSAGQLHQHDMSKHRAFSYPVPKYHVGRSNEPESTDPVDVFTGIPTFAKANLDISGLIRLAKDAFRMRKTTIASIMLEECYVSFLSPAPGSRHLLYDHTYDVHRQKGIDFRKSESAIEEEMAVSGWHNASEKVFRDGNRQFLPVSTLVEHALFYGTQDILQGVWSGLFTEAIGKNPERHLALAVMGANPSAVICHGSLANFHIGPPYML
ncbi:hypothetical protein TWF225_010617 [Orbilia oligospora]|nr:hypothetical protein TWF225_010617 [Orbilia oligospora]KAF3259131.1 hypothetical protein TWF217_005272 [Orbilia oligospora]